MSEPFPVLWSNWAHSYIGFCSAGISAGVSWATLPMKVGAMALSNAVEISVGVELDNAINPETDIILTDVFQASMPSYYDELALMIAEAEGMTAVAAPRVKADITKQKPEQGREAEKEQGIWTYTRPHANQDEEWLERRTGRMVYTPQGGTPDSPSAKRVLERHRARKLRQVI